MKLSAVPPLGRKHFGRKNTSGDGENELENAAMEMDGILNLVRSHFASIHRHPFDYMVEAPDLKKLDEKPPADVKVEEEEAPEAVEGVKFDILEEDDDFEEFKDDEWEDSTLNVDEDLEWEDDWDDEEDDDDFAKRLRAEVQSNLKKTTA